MQPNELHRNSMQSNVVCAVWCRITYQMQAESPSTAAVKFRALCDRDQSTKSCCNLWKIATFIKLTKIESNHGDSVYIVRLNSETILNFPPRDCFK